MGSDAFQEAVRGTRTLAPLRDGFVAYRSSPRQRLQLTLCEARGGAAAGSLVVIAGPPAAGKGTQCERIKERACGACR